MQTVFSSTAQRASVPATIASSEDAGKLVLRAALAALLLFHGVSKLVGGVGFITGMLAKAGLPPAIGYLVYVGEVVAPLMILLGIWTRAASLVVAFNMIVAVLLVHTAQFFTMSQTGGWALELQGLYFAGAIAVALLGAGRYSVGGAAGKWN
ncbi:DoxX family protein [Noviherbaspirillum galbum]|uniref:DoxX family protein n=1 Tax=Noviherbaspirillum galbum TaxID=2709383 RepID=A0A6B3SRG2_9BURK|nr:DoxX family protein [Noviherbaspirillum galbum]NEX61925.1 DoxX family protein [Noviherbaspirillum galbum]